MVNIRQLSNEHNDKLSDLIPLFTIELTQYSNLKPYDIQADVTDVDIEGEVVLVLFMHQSWEDVVEIEIDLYDLDNLTLAELVEELG